MFGGIIIKNNIMTNASCSSFCWETLDGKHLWGRNFGYNAFAKGTGIVFIPRNQKYYYRGSVMEKMKTVQHKLNTLF